jgi:hypothetical protein
MAEYYDFDSDYLIETRPALRGVFAGLTRPTTPRVALLSVDTKQSLRGRQGHSAATVRENTVAFSELLHQLPDGRQAGSWQRDPITSYDVVVPSIPVHESSVLILLQSQNHRHTQRVLGTESVSCVDKLNF